jgi:PAS domain S-box-containing protein
MREDGRVVSSLDGLRELGLAGEDELLRSLLDSTGDGVYATDLDGVCTFANPACVELLGFASDQGLLGQQVHRLVHHTRANGEPYPVEGCPIYRAFDQGEGVHVADEVMFRADGARFPAEYRSHPLFRDGQWWDAWSRSTTSPLAWRWSRRCRPARRSSAPS